MIIFTDAATSPKHSVAVGAFLCLDNTQLEQFSKYAHADLYTILSDQIVYKKFASKKSTWSEIKTVIVALRMVLESRNLTTTIEIYTDCKSLCDLLGRRKTKLQQNNFITRSGKLHPNTDLYKELFAIADQFQIQTFKIKGPAIIEKNGIYADAYKKYFSISTNSQPITQGNWLPFYWCAIYSAMPHDYIHCLDENRSGVSS